VSETAREPVLDEDVEPADEDGPEEEQPAAVAVGHDPDEQTRRLRRRRRLIVTGVSVGAALLVLALCAGLLAAVSALGGFSDDARDDRQEHRLRDAACLELETRLNRVAPPGSTANPAGRAAAIRNENAALRPYLAELQARSRPDDDAGLPAWRQLLDARTAYAEALDRQTASRTPAFFVAPRAADGLAVSDQLSRRSPAGCSGPIRRLAVPDL
jgi:hypothetical protein